MYVIWIWRDDEQRWRKHASEFPLGEFDGACVAGKELSRDFHGPVDVMHCHHYANPHREPVQIAVAQFYNGAIVRRGLRFGSY